MREKPSVNFAHIGFDLVDYDRKGYINTSDLQRLYSDVGKIENDGRENVTISEGEAMIETANTICAHSKDDGNNQQLNFVVFQKLLATPSSP